MLWEELQLLSKRMQLPLHHVFQEEIQKTILTHLSRQAAFNDIVFQGGTSLRFFYDNPRFSEDLDFVMREGKKQYDLIATLSGMRSFVRDIFPFLENITVHPQKRNNDLQRLIVNTHADLPEQNLRIHMELASVPSYFNRPKILQYSPLYPAVRVEDMIEILADKLVALAGRPYLKGRDIWDIHFLTVEKHTTVSWDLVIQKAMDYGITPSTCKKKLRASSKKLRTEGVSVLTMELKRFLPSTLLDQYVETFPTMVAHVATITEQIVRTRVKTNES